MVVSYNAMKKCRTLGQFDSKEEKEEKERKE